jgi:hypothetical protein
VSQWGLMGSNSLSENSISDDFVMRGSTLSIISTGIKCMKEKENYDDDFRSKDYFKKF